jgi:hypothetical protein
MKVREVLGNITERRDSSELPKCGGHGDGDHNRVCLTVGTHVLGENNRAIDHDQRLAVISTRK